MSGIQRRRFTTAGFLLAATLVAATITGCAGLAPGMQPPSITIAELGLGSAGILEQQYNVRLRIQNPNTVDFSVDGIAFELEVNGQPFAKGVGNDTVTVPRFDSGFMNAEAVSTLGALLRQFGRLREGNKALFKYRIKGQLSIAGGTRVPFEEHGEFDFSSVIPKGLAQP